MDLTHTTGMDDPAVPRTWLRAAAVGFALGAGLLLGLLSVGSDYLLSYPWSMIGNVAGTWVLVAFAIGAVADRSIARGAIAGLLALVTATVVYYAAMSLIWPPSSVSKLVPGVVVWGVVALVVGPGAGAAGAAWRGGAAGRSRPRWLRPVAVGAAAAVLAAEGAFLAVTASTSETLLGAGVELVVAGMVPIALVGPARERALAYATLALVGLASLPVAGILIPAIFMLAGSGRL